jgi:apolipoprotein N-acyltransferase
LKQQLSVLVQQINGSRLTVESHDNWHYVRQSCLPANIFMWSRLLATNNVQPPVGNVAKAVEDEKSETKWIEKKSLDIGTEVLPVEKKPLTDKEPPKVVVMEKKSLMTEAEQQSTKTNMLKEVVNKGTIITISKVGLTTHQRPRVAKFIRSLETNQNF